MFNGSDDDYYYGKHHVGRISPYKTPIDQYEDDQSSKSIEEHLRDIFYILFFSFLILIIIELFILFYFCIARKNKSKVHKQNDPIHRSWFDQITLVSNSVLPESSEEEENAFTQV